MKVIIIGGVAGGASIAARLRRLDEKTVYPAEVVVLGIGVRPENWLARTPDSRSVSAAEFGYMSTCARETRILLQHGFKAHNPAGGMLSHAMQE